MKWYLAGRTRHIKNLRLVGDALRNKEEEVVSNWFYGEKFDDYESQLPLIQDLAVTIIHEVQESDIFVLISDEKGTDMFLELGVALGKSISKEIKIYIVGKHSKRSIMSLHPKCEHVADLGVVFKKEGIDMRDFIVPDLR